MEYTSLKTIIELAKSQNKKISEFVLEEQSKDLNLSKDEVLIKMKNSYKVMCDSIQNGFNNKCKLKIEQEDGAKIYKKYVDSDKSILGKKLGMAVAMAMAVSEVNASMGRIVAAPTAGSCGILPAAVMSIKDAYNISDEDVVMALFTASAIGMVIANVSSIAGATGGCQAECGAAIAMAAGAIVEMLGGDYSQIENAVAISIQNIEGLVCDPVAGLVECPCIKRNASGAINAILASDMALGGIKSIIPVDEVILSMKQVGEIMDDRLKETANGGLAATNTGKELKRSVFGE